MKLLISQKDSIYDLIESVGLTPSQFEFFESGSSSTEGQIKTTLIFKESDFYFVFENGPNTLDKHYAIYCPGDISYEKYEYPVSWQLQYNTVFRWLNNLLKEINSPNKWERLGLELENIKLSFNNDQDKFSVQEYEEIVDKIHAIKQGLGSIGLLQDQIEIINQKLDYLTEMAKVLNKFDWKSLFVGSIASIVIQLGVTPEHIKSLWTLIKNIFSNNILP